MFGEKSTNYNEEESCFQAAQSPPFLLWKGLSFLFFISSFLCILRHFALKQASIAMTQCFLCFSYIWDELAGAAKKEGSQGGATACHYIKDNPPHFMYINEIKVQNLQRRESYYYLESFHNSQIVFCSCLSRVLLHPSLISELWLAVWLCFTYFLLRSLN